MKAEFLPEKVWEFSFFLLIAGRGFIHEDRIWFSGMAVIFDLFPV